MPADKDRLVLNAWIRGESKSYSRHNIFCEDDTVYSYGRHFPLATILGRDKAGFPTVFLVNGSTYSNFTSKHQRTVSGFMDKIAEYAEYQVVYHMDTGGVQSAKSRRRYSKRDSGSSNLKLNTCARDIPMLSMTKEQLWARLAELYWRDGKIHLLRRIKVAEIDSLVETKQLLKAL